MRLIYTTMKYELEKPGKAGVEVADGFYSLKIFLGMSGSEFPFFTSTIFVLGCTF
ncbi:hypothetical protein ACFOG5_19430 [Pedobacter fastidiosus]|uniref:hypothetical protein n=1 Tax=Pedobacter fastidiosus TaxID=2765361 RepID=UPI0036138540